MKEKFKNAPDEYMFHPLAESAQVRNDGERRLEGEVALVRSCLTRRPILVAVKW